METSILISLEPYSPSAHLSSAPFQLPKSRFLRTFIILNIKQPEKEED